MVVDSTCACAAALGSAPAFGSAPLGSASGLISAPAPGAGTGATRAGGGAAGGHRRGGRRAGRAGEKLVRGLAGGAWSDRGRSGVTQLHLLLGDMKRQKI